MRKETVGTKNLEEGIKKIAKRTGAAPSARREGEDVLKERTGRLRPI